MTKLFRSLIAVAALVTVGTGCGDDTTDPGEAPGAPSSVQIVVLGDSITVTWTAGANATSHRVVASATGEQDRSQTVTGATEAGFGGLTAGATYGVLVTAINSAGETPAAAPVLSEIPEDVIFVFDDVLTNTTWTNDKTWVLRGPVFVGRDIDEPSGVAVTLTIEPGTTVLGDVNPPQGARGSYLVITRGSRLVADANASLTDKSVRPDPDSVIVFTSSAPRGQRARGDWGGLVINGRAPINSGPEAQGEGESGLYGGTDANDDSGILRGVRVEFAGDDVTATDQLNGIALQGVGAGTTIDYVQVHYNVDDGTEPFGGTVSQTHMVMTGIGDDSFDGTDGYKGFMQFLIAQQRGDDADNGFEISNNADTEDAAPHTTAVIANATMIGAGENLGSGEISALGTQGDIGANFREGANYRVFNSIFTGFGDSGFCVEGAGAAANADNRLGGSADPDVTLRFENNILFNNVDATTPAQYTACGGYTAAENQTFAEMFDNIVADPNLPASAFNVGSRTSPPDVIPTATPGGYTAIDVSTLNSGPGLVMPVDGRTLQATAYAGAVAPGTALADAWYFGWTVWATDGSDSRPNHNGQ